MNLNVIRNAIFVLLFSLMSACTSMADNPSAIGLNPHEKLASDARDSLKLLYASSPKAKQLARHANAILIFPDVLKGGLIVGAAGGDGVLLRPDGTVMGYYNATSLTYGLQAGAQEFSEAMILMSPAALSYLQSTGGLSIGTGPTVAIIDVGMAKDVSTTTLRSDVYAFVFGQKGLMAGLGLQAQKITRLSN